MKDLVLVMLACASCAPAPTSCTRSSTPATCTEPSNPSGCASVGGTYAGVECSRTDRLGGCRDPLGDTIVWVYRDGTTTAGDVYAACLAQGRAFVSP